MPFLLFSCKNENSKIPVANSEIKSDALPTIDKKLIVDEHNSKNTLDWQGIYKGVTPCANCKGIATEIVLYKNLTFSIKTQYLGKGNGKIFEEKGVFSWDENGAIISLLELENRPNEYKVGENKLIQLDINGKEISGDLAQMYVLLK